MSSPVLALPAALQHEVWRLTDAARAAETVSSGVAGLDAELPGGGWPLGALVELLQDEPGRGVWSLLLPALVQALHRQPGPVVLVGVPQMPFMPALQAQGLPAARLLWVRAAAPAARLWGAEQALGCADVAAVLAWLPQARAAELRRLHLAAQRQGRLLFVFRGLRAAQSSSCARLRLELRPEGVETLEVRILKRRGPPLEQPLRLPLQPARLAALLMARRSATEVAAAGLAGHHPVPENRSHVLDRSAAPA